MTTINQNFNIVAGDSKNIVVTVTKNDGTPLNLAGASIRWGFSDVIKDVTNGVIITDAVNGQFTVVLKPADTEGKSGKQKHEAEITDQFGNVSTVMRGELTIERSVI